MQLDRYELGTADLGRRPFASRGDRDAANVGARRRSHDDAGARLRERCRLKSLAYDQGVIAHGAREQRLQRGAQPRLVGDSPHGIHGGLHNCA